MNQYEIRELIKKTAMPDMPATPTQQSCSVEQLANEIAAGGDCRRTATCALCTLSGLTCDQIVSIGSES